MREFQFGTRNLFNVRGLDGSMLLKSCFEEKKFDKAFVFGCEISVVVWFLGQDNRVFVF
jgi:hypothetical protein